MVSILYRVHQNLMFLGEKNWANRYAPATTSVINRSFARYNRTLDQNTPLGFRRAGCFV